MPVRSTEPPWRLDRTVETDRPRGLVLLLHGGQQRSREAVRGRHASWWRMAWLGWSLRRFARRDRLCVFVLRHRLRGWNDPLDPDPVRDATDALDRLRALHPGVPIVLVGHSMGGRTACRIADRDGVVGVVALAPWLPDDEPVTDFGGRTLAVLHGAADRWTSPVSSRRYVDLAGQTAAEATWQSLPGAGHFMFRRVGVWRRFIEESVRAALSRGPSRGR